MSHPASCHRTWFGLILVAVLVLAASPVRAQSGPSFSVVSASVDPNPVSPGVNTTIAAAIKNSGSLGSGIVVDMEIYDSSGARVDQQVLGGQTFASGETKTYQWSWILPANQPSGTYTVKIGIFAAHWTELYLWDGNAATFTVQANGPVVAFGVGTITASPTAIPSGGTVSITAPVTNTGGSPASGITVLLQLTDPFGNGFEGNEQAVGGQSFDPGQARTYAFQWQAPPGAAQGIYAASIGVFSSDWSQLYAWGTNSSAFTVGTAQQPTFTLGATSASPTTVARGQSVTIATQVTDTSSVPASSIVVQCELNNAADSQNIMWQAARDLTFSAGQTRALAFVFPIPSDFPPGNYTIDIGVFNSDWSTVYAWGYLVATFTVQ